MTVTVLLSCSALLLASAILAVAMGRPSASPVIYGLSLVASLVSFAAAVFHLPTEPTAVTTTLPLGLPWLGSHFRIDVLSAYFLAVVDLGAAAASLFALGYGRHEPSPMRV